MCHALRNGGGRGNRRRKGVGGVEGVVGIFKQKQGGGGKGVGKGGIGEDWDALETVTRNWGMREGLRVVLGGGIEATLKGLYIYYFMNSLRC